MPITVETTAGGTVHGNPFVGPINHTAAIRIDISGLTANEVDANGYLKPGVPFTAAGALVGTDDAVFGCAVEGTKVAANNGAALATAPDFDVAVATICQVNQDILEDVLGRALTADEIAGFAAAGSTCKLL